MFAGAQGPWAGTVCSVKESGFPWMLEFSPTGPSHLPQAAGLVWLWGWVRIVRHPSFLGPSPSHNHSACVRIYCARAVSQDGKGLDLSWSPTSLCIPLPCVACPESTALHTAGHPQPHERFWEAQPLTTSHTPDPASMLPFHPPTTVLLSHIILSITSLNNSTATTEILWIY